jgi:hypothetical protein
LPFRSKSSLPRRPGFGVVGQISRRHP